MSIPIERLVLVGPSYPAIHQELRHLLIPPHSFSKSGIWLVTGRSDLERIRGIGEFVWAAIPNHDPGPFVSSTLAASSKVSRPVAGRLDWHEAIAMRLAWRVWHEQ